MPPTVRRSDFADILLRVQYELVRRLDWAPERVVVTAADPDDVPHQGASQDVLLRPREERPDEAVIDGAGRVCNLRHRSLEVVMRSRLSLDGQGASPSQLTDDSLGHLRLESAVCDALEVFQAGDPELSAYGLPMRVGGLTMPRQDRKDPNWVSSSFTVELAYERDLDQDRARQ